MKKTIITLLTLMLNSFLVLLIAQTVEYGYDNCGNITSRKTIMLKTNTFAVDSIAVPKILEDALISVKIYPNPTSGELKIEVPDYKNNEAIVFQIYDMSGRLLINTTGVGMSNMLDLSSFPNGTYILRMTRNNVVSSWRVIKTN